MVSLKAMFLCCKYIGRSPYTLALANIMLIFTIRYMYITKGLDQLHEA